MGQGVWHIDEYDGWFFLLHNYKLKLSRPARKYYLQNFLSNITHFLLPRYIYMYVIILNNRHLIFQLIRQWSRQI